MHLFNGLIISIYVLILPVSTAKDVCHGPLLKLSIEGNDSRSRPYFGVSAYFGEQLDVNKTLSGALVSASPLDACSALLEPLPGEIFCELEHEQDNPWYWYFTCDIAHTVTGI